MVQRARKGLKGWALEMVMAAMAVGIVIEAFFLVPVVQRQAEASKAGADARVRQCEVRGTSRKEQEFFHARGVISWQELQAYLAGMPSPQECAALGVKAPRHP